MELFDYLKQLVKRLEQADVPYALCGGLAMAVYQLPRATMDIDLLIEESFLPEVKSIAFDLGYTLEAGMMEFAKGKIKIYRATQIDSDSGEVLPLDLLLVTPVLEDVWESRKSVYWKDGLLRVVSREGLIKLKRLRNSGQDQDDIKHLENI